MSGDEEYRSTSIRKIDNGYITTQTKNVGGDYTTEETFSKDKPKIEVQVTAPTKPVGNALTAAKTYLRQGGASTRGRK